MVAKDLVDKWFYTYGIPAHIHSHQVKSFYNHIIEQLWNFYGIHQSTTTPYNLLGNSSCKCFNHTLQNVLKKLLKDQKYNLPKDLTTLVFAYNAPHIPIWGIIITSLYLVISNQHLMIIGWVWSNAIIVSPFLRSPWVQEQYELIQFTNKC